MSLLAYISDPPRRQISILNAPEARNVPNQVTTIIAGSAPTAKLIGDLEQKGINPIHVYGLTYVFSFCPRLYTNEPIGRSERHVLKQMCSLTSHLQTYGPFTKAYPQPEWSALPLEERARFLARQGFGFLTSEPVRVVYQPKEGEEDLDKELVDVPKDGKTVGEIVMRGNICLKEYFNDPAATRKALQGGWFHSGDLAVVHPDGYISVQDRSKDIIISGGEVGTILGLHAN